jgi:hypothetical protein
MLLIILCRSIIVEVYANVGPYISDKVPSIGIFHVQFYSCVLCKSGLLFSAILSDNLLITNSKFKTEIN